MRPRPKHALVALIAALLIFFAYAPLMRAGLLAEDYGILLSAGSSATPGATVPLDPSATLAAPEGFGVSTPPVKPLTAASLQLSKALSDFPAPIGRQDGGGLMRMEQLMYLLLAAIGLGFFVRRLLLPWSGSEHATGTGRAAALLFAVHPLAVLSVAQLAARGELLGLMFAIWSAYLFLRGRQDRVVSWTAAALLLAIVSGFASHLALGLPPLLFAADLISTHRYRPVRTRLRTATTTLLLFGLGVSLDYLRVFALGEGAGIEGFLAPMHAFVEGATWPGSLSLAAEKLGFLILPVNSAVVGFAGIAVAGAIFLLALQPALSAARSAPRLWGWLLSGWLLALGVSQFLHFQVRMAPDDLARVHSTLPSIAVMAAGLGLCATALSGPRRPYMAWVVAVAYACLGHANARPWPGAARNAAQLRRDLFAAHDIHGDMRTLVLDPPAATQGIEGVGAALPFLAHPDLRRVAAEADEAPTGAAGPEVHGMPTEVFLALLEEPEFRAWLGEDMLILYPYASLGDSTGGGPAGEHGEAGALESADFSGGLMDRPYSRFQPGEPSAGPYSWNKSLRSPALELSPLEYSALRVTLDAGRDPSELGSVSWRSRGVPDRGSHAGAWTSARASDGGSADVVGLFDLGSSLAWRIGGRVRAMFFEHGSRAIDTATLLRGLPDCGDLSPVVEGGAWVLGTPRIDPGYGAGTWRLQLLDLVAFERKEFPVTVASDGSLRVESVEDYRQGLRRAGPVGWILEYLIADRVVARDRGRL